MFYRTTAGDPIIYLEIDLEEMKEYEGFDKMEIVSTLSAKGDKCHYDIKNVHNKKEQNFFLNYCKLPLKLFICCGQTSYNWNVEDVLNFDCNSI